MRRRLEPPAIVSVASLSPVRDQGALSGPRQSGLINGDQLAARSRRDKTLAGDAIDGTATLLASALISRSILAWRADCLQDDTDMNMSLGATWTIFCIP